MSDRVCDYCGKTNGWHLWGCPNLKFPAHFQVFGIGDEPKEAVIVESLPEVE